MLATATTKTLDVALLGNPNVGKSTLFNHLTGLRQHTGNWPGKTVEVASGRCRYNNFELSITDLPGLYSLLTDSPEEAVTLEYILTHRPERVVLLLDATALERGLNLLLQVLEVTPRVIVALNLMDEARKNGLVVDSAALSKALSLPVVEISAAKGEGIGTLLEAITGTLPLSESPLCPCGPALERALTMAEEELYHQLPGEHRRFGAFCLLLGRRSALDPLLPQGADTPLPALTEPRRLLTLSGIPPERLYDEIAACRAEGAKLLLKSAAGQPQTEPVAAHRRLDRLLCSRTFGVPFMLLLLGMVFWITICGANYPSALLGTLLFSLGDHMEGWLLGLSTPLWLVGLLIDGVWRTAAWVVSVMLPPMAIFFPLFGLLEDLGYLPRVAFNLDGAFYRCGACGRQALTM